MDKAWWSREIDRVANTTVSTCKTCKAVLRPIRVEKKVKTNLQWIDADGKTLYYTANKTKPADYHVYRYHIAEDRHELILEEPGYWFIADKHEGKLLMVKAKGNTSRAVYLYDSATRKLTALFGQDEEEQYSVAFNHEGDVLTLTNTFDDFKRLYLYRGARFEPLTEAKPYDIAPFFTDRQKRRIHLRLVREGRFSFAFLDSSGKPLEGPRFEGATHTLLGGLSPNGRYMTLGVTFHDRPRSSYVYDWQNANPRALDAAVIARGRYAWLYPGRADPLPG